jgi:hypothetical protein
MRYVFLARRVAFGFEEKLGITLRMLCGISTLFEN